MIMPTPQLNEVTELKQLNNVSGVSIVDTTTEDATSKTDESQSSQVNSINIEESPSTVANSNDLTEEAITSMTETSTKEEVE